MHLALINFRSKDRYIADDIASLGDFYFEGPQNFYNLSDVVTANKGKKYDSKSKTFVYDDSVDYSYARYLSKSINGIEFAWNASVHALDFEVVPAEKEIQTTGYSGATFYSTSEKAVSVECTTLLDDVDYIDNTIYCYFDKALKKSQLIITESNDNRKNYDISTFRGAPDWEKDNYIYTELHSYDKKTSFTLGFYKRK